MSIYLSNVHRVLQQAMTLVLVSCLHAKLEHFFPGWFTAV